MAAALTRVAAIRRCQNRCRRTPDFGKNFARKNRGESLTLLKQNPDEIGDF